MRRGRLVGGLLVAGMVTWLILPHVFGEFFSTREKVVRSPLTVEARQFRVAIPAGAAIDGVAPPLAAIIRLRNDAASTLAIRIDLDERHVCAADIPPGVSRRLDCVITGPSLEPREHTVTFDASTEPYTIENLELATHFGALTPGPRNLIVGPSGFSGFRGPNAAHAILIFMLLAFSAWSQRDRVRITPVRLAHAGATLMVGSVVAIVVLSSVVSKYSVLIGDTFLEKLLLLVALPAIWRSGVALVAWLRQPAAAPVARPVAVGVLVGSLFLLFAIHVVTARYDGHASGLVVISPYFFDKDPMVAGRDDIRQSVFFSEGHGYDGQFLYFMTFDPFLTVYRDEPHRYGDFIDFPPYRYGRIGFSLLTKMVSANQPTWYPITMVALVLVSLGACGALLGAIAQRRGLSVLYGLLVIVVPGFWQSVKSALPEPLAIALILAAYLCLMRQKWLVAGLLLGSSMLVRETGGVFVLAAVAGLLLVRQWRAAVGVALLAFLPVVVWKAFVGWVFWPEYGMIGVMPHPNDVGWPFAGVWEMWTTILRGQYFTGSPEMARAGVMCSILTTAALVLALAAVIRRPRPIAVVALLYAVLTITFNYDAVWMHVGNADRLTIDLFVALAVVTLESARDRTRLSAALAVFWAATACYVFFGAYEAAVLRHSIQSLF